MTSKPFTEKKGFAYVTTTQPPLTTTLHPAGPCELGSSLCPDLTYWYCPGLSNCYKIVASPTRNWDQSNPVCGGIYHNAQRGHLVEVNSVTENDALEFIHTWGESMDTLGQSSWFMWHFFYYFQKGIFMSVQHFLGLIP